MINHVWIVEVLFSYELHRGWLPTVGVALNRQDGREELKRWQNKLPNDKLRLKKYGPA